jgi:tetratricopeptide (TPR) repeat protein
MPSFVATGILAVGLALQAGAQRAPERSHVERFADPKEVAERDEAAATARLRQNARDAEALADRGTARVLLGKLDGALADFRRAAELAPRQTDLHTSIGYILTRLNRRAEARDAFDRALALDPENFLANYHLGRMLLLAGDAKAAVLNLEKAIAVRPDTAEIRFDLLTAYRLVGDAVKANAQLRYLRQARPRDARIVYAEGLLALDRGDVDAGIEKLRSAIAADPRLVGARQDLALAYIRGARWTDAEPILAEIVGRAPGALEPGYLYALTLFNLGRAAEAEARLRPLAARYPKAAPVVMLLGVVRSANGAPATELVELFRRAVELNPRAFDAQFYLGRALYSARDRVGAIAALDEAVKIDPKHVKARFFLATALEDDGQTEAAAAQYEELARLAPDSPEGHVGLGAVHVKLGELEAAIAALRRAVELDASLFEAHYALGRALVRAGQIDGGVASLARAVELEPERADAHYQLGLALRRAGRAEEAAREFETVERLNEQFRSQTNGMGMPVGPNR